MSLAFRPTVLAAGFLAVACGGDPASEEPGPEGATAPATITGRFSPPEGQAILIVGQDVGAMAGYVEHVHTTPGGVTTYTSLRDLDDLATAANWGPDLFDTLTGE